MLTIEQRISRSIIKHRSALLLLLISVTVLLSYGMLSLGFNSDFKVFINKDNPQAQTLERIAKDYADQGDNAQIIIKTNAGDIFTEEILAEVSTLTAQAWQLPYSSRVESITNFPHSVAADDEINIGNLIDFESQKNTDRLAAIKDIALSEPRLVRRLVSPNGESTVIDIAFAFPSDGKQTELIYEVVEAVNALADSARERMPHLEIMTSAGVYFDYTLLSIMTWDMLLLFPLILLVTMVLLAYVFRSIALTVATLSIVLFSAVIVFGTFGYFGLSLNTVSVSAALIVATLAIADSVHICNNYLLKLDQGNSQLDSMLHSLEVNLGPVFFTSATTAIGFLGLNFSESPPYHDLGNMTAVGVMVAMVLSMVIIPYVALRWHKPSKRPQPLSNESLESFGFFVLRHYKIFSYGMAPIIAILIGCIFLNTLDDDSIEYIDESNAFRQSLEYSAEHLSGIRSIYYNLDSGETNGIYDPEFLKNVAKFTQWLEQQPEAVKVTSFLDDIKSLNKMMNNNEAKYYSVPESRGLIAQYALLYEMALPQGRSINNLVNLDRSGLLLEVTLKNLRNTALTGFDTRVQNWLADNLHYTTESASASLLFAQAGVRNLSNMVWGSFSALAIIAALLVLVLRSLKYGLLSLIPNALPIAVTYGIWGIFVGEVNTAAAVTFCVSLGICVDDTVHFMAKYLREKRSGLDTETSIINTYIKSGPSLIYTTIILCIGFFIHAQSELVLNSTIGYLVGITVILALLFDLVVLPASIMATHKLSGNTHLDNTLSDNKRAAIKQ